MPAENSVQMVGRAYFSHKEMEHKSNSEIQDMLMLQKESIGMIFQQSRSVAAA